MLVSDRRNGLLPRSSLQEKHSWNVREDDVLLQESYREVPDAVDLLLLCNPLKEKLRDDELGDKRTHTLLPP